MIKDEYAEIQSHFKYMLATIEDAQFQAILRRSQKALSVNFRSRKKHAEAWGLIKEGITEVNELAAQMGVARRTVQLILNHFERTNRITYNQRPASEKGGRPVKVIVVLKGFANDSKNSSKTS